MVVVDDDKYTTCIYFTNTTEEIHEKTNKYRESDIIVESSLYSISMFHS